MLKAWLAARARRKERDYFNRGYQWAKSALDHGQYTVDALLALAEGVFNDNPYERSFDAGVRAAAKEEGGGV